MVALRNFVDEQERLAEPARALFSAERFAAFRTLDADAIRRRIKLLAAAIEAAQESGQSAMMRLIRDSVGSRRFQRIAEADRELRADADLLGVTSPSLSVGDGQTVEIDSAAWEHFRIALSDRLELAARVRNYWQSLDHLRAARPLEELARDLTRIADESVAGFTGTVAMLAPSVAEPLDFPNNVSC